MMGTNMLKLIGNKDIIKLPMQTYRCRLKSQGGNTITMKVGSWIYNPENYISIFTLKITSFKTKTPKSMLN